jgi:hypothetical protein
MERHRDWLLRDTLRALLSASPSVGGEDCCWIGDEKCPIHGGREGMVTAYDHEGRYVGCIGEQTWRWLIDHPEIDLPAMQRGFDLFRPDGGGA